MIQLVKRNQIDEEKYNHCITKSIESSIFGYSWYLDIIADNWDALVLNDYDAVMPLPWRKKAGFKYVYPPFWLIELGVFSTLKNVDVKAFINALFMNFRFVESRLNTQNQLLGFPAQKLEMQIQMLSLKDSYETILLAYNRNRKRELKKANDVHLTEQWNDDPKNLIALFKDNVGQRVEKLQEKDYQVLLKLLNVCIERNVGEVLSIYEPKSKLVGSAFFLKHQNTVTALVVSSDFKNRDNGVNTFLNDRAIFKYQKDFEIFHFGGSSMETIANYYKSFGAETKNYFLLKKRLL